MPESSASHHCPFLNRADRRCSEHFSLDHLRHAFEFCFDSYKTCPHYLEMLVERQVKRVSASIGAVASTGAGSAGGAGSATGMKIGAANAGNKLVQITLPRRYAQSAA
jgi:hypothetical protein